MFIEPTLPFGSKSNQKYGWIEVICGSMFSGKTEELIRRLRRAEFANLKVKIFKPKLDNRYDEEKVVSHNSNFIDSQPVDYAQDILLMGSDYEVIGIDEAQFFDQKIVEVCDQLANQGKRVIVAGLDMDFEGKPFGPMPNLLAIAEFVTKVHAVCVQTGGMAHYSFRKIDDMSKVKLGEKDIYEPRSRSSFKDGQARKKAFEKKKP